MESWGNCLTCARLICSRGGRARGFTRCEIVSRVGTLERRHNGRGCSQSSRDALPRRGRSNRCETLALVRKEKSALPYGGARGLEHTRGWGALDLSLSVLESGGVRQTPPRVPKPKPPPGGGASFFLARELSG